MVLASAQHEGTRGPESPCAHPISYTHFGANQLCPAVGACPVSRAGALPNEFGVRNRFEVWLRLTAGQTRRSETDANMLVIDRWFALRKEKLQIVLARRSHSSELVACASTWPPHLVVESVAKIALDAVARRIAVLDVRVL